MADKFGDSELMEHMEWVVRWGAFMRSVRSSHCFGCVDEKFLYDKMVFGIRFNWFNWMPEKPEVSPEIYYVVQTGVMWFFVSFGDFVLGVAHPVSTNPSKNWRWFKSFRSFLVHLNALIFVQFSCRIFQRRPTKRIGSKFNECFIQKWKMYYFYVSECVAFRRHPTFLHSFHIFRCPGIHIRPRPNFICTQNRLHCSVWLICLIHARTQTHVIYRNRNLRHKVAAGGQQQQQQRDRLCWKAK